MIASSLVPGVLRRRYSAKITAAMLGIAALTVAVGALFTAHALASGDAETVSTDATLAALVGIMFVFLVHLGLAGIVLGGNVSLALARLTDRAERIGEGELDVDLEHDRVDEVGRLYDSFATMRDSLEVTLADLDEQRERAIAAQRETRERNEALVAEAERFSEVMETCADGDLRHRLDPQIEDEAMVSIATSFNEMVEQLEATIAQVQRFSDGVDRTSTEVESSADEIKSASEEVSGSVQEIADGARQQAEDLSVASEEVTDLSATVEEIASTTGTIASRSEEVADLAETGRTQAATATAESRDAADRTETVVETIRRLNRDAEQIEEIITLIDDIAEQTNMLALNANIEASRGASGGDGAEGFGVVANEVKELSAETREAVDEIETTLQSIMEAAAVSAEEIEAVDDSISTATATMEGLRTELEEIADGVQSVDQGVQEIDDATSSQADSAAELTTIVDDVASVAAETSSQAQQAAAAAEESTATIEEVSTVIGTLDSRADRLADAVDTFAVEAAADGGDDR